MFTLFVSTVFGQRYNYYSSDSLIISNSNSSILPFALSGGYHCPQFSPCDLDDDGKKDIVVYDKLDGSVSTYINKGNIGEVKYVLDNRYAAYFPKFKPFSWMLMRDFNQDGYEDIFTAGPNGYVVYKNISYTVSGRPEFAELPTLVYRNMSPKGSFIEYNALSTPSIHLPGIFDIDFDGDLDILSYSNVGGAITYYQNNQVELGLPPDSMRFFNNDLCWGYFTDYDCNNYTLNTCSDNDLYRLYTLRHTNGSSITLFDADNDKDIDLLIGNEGCSHMTMLYNEKLFNMNQYDSFSSFDTNYVTAGNRAEVSIYPAAYFMDVNNDGARDLIYAPNSVNFQYLIEEVDQIFWFENIGSDSLPVWGQQKPFLTTELIDDGNRNQWACEDWDGDGDLDCIVATNGNAIETKNLDDRIYLYENIGDSKNANLKLVNKNFGNFVGLGIENLKVAIADMDNDNKLDLVCGNNKGEILFYKNTSASNTTLNPQFTLSNAQYPGFDIDIGGFSSPAVADIDNDGLKDLVIGRLDSMLSYYKNTGTLTQPSFTIVTNKFGNMKPIDSIGFQYIYDDTNAIIGYYPVYEKFIYSSPVIRDIDGDDTLEIIIGNSLGSLRMYKINGDKPTSTFKQIDSFYYMLGFQSQKFDNFNLGRFISPCLADFDSDTVPELIISCNRGGIQYLKNNFSFNPKVSLRDIVYKTIRAYPNPAQSKIEFDVDPNEIQSIEVFNSLGQEIKNIQTFSENITTLDVADWRSGFYLVRIRLINQELYTSKFQVIH
ncbi:MAG: FG-GAP-like repeat-containing protein [Bacteroidia bacterium]